MNTVVYVIAAFAILGGASSLAAVGVSLRRDRRQRREARMLSAIALGTLIENAGLGDAEEWGRGRRGKRLRRQRWDEFFRDAGVEDRGWTWEEFVAALRSEFLGMGLDGESSAEAPSGLGDPASVAEIPLEIYASDAVTREQVLTGMNLIAELEELTEE